MEPIIKMREMFMNAKNPLNMQCLLFPWIFLKMLLILLLKYFPISP